MLAAFDMRFGRGNAVEHIVAEQVGDRGAAALVRHVQHVDVGLAELTTLQQTEALKAGRIDIGFGRIVVDDPAIARHVVVTESLLVAAGLGVTVVPASVQRPHRDDVAYVPLVAPPVCGQQPKMAPCRMLCRPPWNPRTP